MEFNQNVNEIFKSPIVEINHSLIPPGYTGDRRALRDVVSKVSDIVNAMGESSAAAQGLSKPITTADRLRNSEHKLYFLIDQNANGGRGAITGMLKTGNKSLYVFDRDGVHYQVSPPCLLDFYIHESRQRNGLGKQLFEHMLQKEKIEPVQMAIDRPSDKLLKFFNKHYRLNEPVKQMNNYVVYDGFFPKRGEPVPQEPEVEESRNVANFKKNSANGLQAFQTPLGRYGAPRPVCSMGQIIHNQTPTIDQRQEPSGVQSMPSTNYQGTPYSPLPNTHETRSTPNMYYGNQAVAPNNLNQSQTDWSQNNPNQNWQSDPTTQTIVANNHGDAAQIRNSNYQNMNYQNQNIPQNYNQSANLAYQPSNIMINNPTSNMNGQTIQMNMAEQYVQESMIGQSNQMNMTRQPGQVNMTGQPVQTSIAGQPSQINMTRQSGQVSMFGQPSQMNRGGQPAQLSLSGQPGQMNMSGQPSQLNMSGLPSQMHMAEQSNQMNMAEQAGQMNMTSYQYQQPGSVDNWASGDYRNMQIDQQYQNMTPTMSAMQVPLEMMKVTNGMDKPEAKKRVQQFTATGQQEPLVSYYQDSRIPQRPNQYISPRHPQTTQSAIYPGISGQNPSMQGLQPPHVVQTMPNLTIRQNYPVGTASAAYFNHANNQNQIVTPRSQPISQNQIPTASAASIQRFNGTQSHNNTQGVQQDGYSEHQQNVQYHGQHGAESADPNQHIHTKAQQGVGYTHPLAQQAVEETKHSHSRNMKHGMGYTYSQAQQGAETKDSKQNMYSRVMPETTVGHSQQNVQRVPSQNEISPNMSQTNYVPTPDRAYTFQSPSNPTEAAVQNPIQQSFVNQPVQQKFKNQQSPTVQSPPNQLHLLQQNQPNPDQQSFESQQNSAQQNFQANTQNYQNQPSFAQQNFQNMPHQHFQAQPVVLQALNLDNQQSTDSETLQHYQSVPIQSDTAQTLNSALMNSNNTQQNLQNGPNCEFQPNESQHLQLQTNQSQRLQLQPNQSQHLQFQPTVSVRQEHPMRPSAAHPNLHFQQNPFHQNFQAHQTRHQQAHQNDQMQPSPAPQNFQLQPNLPLKNFQSQPVVNQSQYYQSPQMSAQHPERVESVPLMSVNQQRYGQVEQPYSVNQSGDYSPQQHENQTNENIIQKRRVASAAEIFKTKNPARVTLSKLAKRHLNKLTEPSECELTYGYPPQLHDDVQNANDVVQQPPTQKLERPRSLIFQHEEFVRKENKQIEEKELEDFGNDPSPGEDVLDSLEMGVEQLDLSQAEKIKVKGATENFLCGEDDPSPRKTPSHLTDQGYFDLKFYHNKLW